MHGANFTKAHLLGCRMDRVAMYGAIILDQEIRHATLITIDLQDLRSTLSRGCQRLMNQSCVIL